MIGCSYSSAENEVWRSQANHSSSPSWDLHRALSSSKAWEPLFDRNLVLLPVLAFLGSGLWLRHVNLGPLKIKSPMSSGMALLSALIFSCSCLDLPALCSGVPASQVPVIKDTSPRGTQMGVIPHPVPGSLDLCLFSPSPLNCPCTHFSSTWHPQKFRLRGFLWRKWVGSMREFVGAL